MGLRGGGGFWRWRKGEWEISGKMEGAGGRSG